MEDQIKAEAFLNSLFSEWIGKGMGEIEIRCLKGTGDKKDPRGGFVDSVEQAAKTALDFAKKGWDSYVGVNLRSDRDRSEKGIKYATVIHTDVDYGQGHNKPSKYETEEEALSAIDNFPISPSLIVKSGGGFHVYWLLSEPVNVGEIGADSIKGVNKAVSVAIGGDSGTQDLSRILRIPGTINYKLRGNQRPVTLLRSGGPKYRIEDFAEYMPRVLAKAVPKAKAKPVLESLNMQGVLTVDDLRADQEIKLLIKKGAPKGERSEKIWRCLRSLMEVGYTDAEVFNLIWTNPIGEKAHEQGETWLRQDILRAKEKPESEQSVTTDAVHLTDMGNALRFVKHHGENLHYCYPWARWLCWDGKRWSNDDTGSIYRMAKDTVRKIYGEAEQSGDKDDRKKLSIHATKSESEARVRAMLLLAQSEEGIPVRPDDMDGDPWLLNVANGVVDLRTGELRAHRREDLMTRLSPVEYNAEANCPFWMNHLNLVFQGNARLIEFLQVAVGYSLTGVTDERCLFIAFGGGANGKSTTQELIAEMLGDYAVRTPTESLLVRHGGGIPNDLAKLKGARFVFCSEVEEGRRLSESTVKDLTGGDTISARFMRSEWFTFIPLFKIWMSTNHKPVIRGTDNAIWSRIRLIPFIYSIPEDKRIPRSEFMDQLKPEFSGILAWAVKGCLKWVKDRLLVPDEIREANTNYRNEMDVIGGFIAEYCWEGSRASAGATKLYIEYTEWCKVNGEYSISQKMFGTKLSERGFRSSRSVSGRKQWIGIGLLDEKLQSNELEVGYEPRGVQ